MKIISSVLIICSWMLIHSPSFSAQDSNSLPRPRPNHGIAPVRPTVVADPSDEYLENSSRPVFKMRKVVKEKLRITDEEKANYKKDLNDNKASLVRLLSAFSCSTALVVDLSDPRCTEDAYLFEGSYYSFRYKGYGEGPWTDLSLVEGEFTAGNKWNTVGFIIDLGKDADFNQLDEDAKEIKYLWKLPSAETLAEKKELRENLEKGFTFEDVFVSSKAKFQIDHVYLLRTTTYRVQGGMAMFRSAFNWYNTDSLFVFKAMDFDGQRTATIGWKRLLQRVAPLLKDKDKDKEKEKTREG